MTKYDLIVADPPWPLRKIPLKTRPKQGILLDYPTMSIEEIKSVPVQRITADDCFLFLWTVQKYLEHSFDVVRCWGFKPILTMTWNKTNGLKLFGFNWMSEFVIVGIKGRIPTFRYGRQIPTVFTAKSKRHSEKPDEFFTLIEHLGSKRLEMFARKKRLGWDAFGNEVQSDVDLNV